MFEAGIKLAALGVIARFDPFTNQQPEASYNMLQPDFESLSTTALLKLGKSVRNLARKQCPLCFDFQFLLIVNSTCYGRFGSILVIFVSTSRHPGLKIGCPIPSIE